MILEKTLFLFAFFGVASLAYDIPAHCTKYYDGCNECSVLNGELDACTERACFVQTTDYCMAYEPGFDADCLDVCVDVWQPICAQTTHNQQDHTFGNMCEMQSYLCHHASVEMTVLAEGETCEELGPHVGGPHIPELDNPEDNNCWTACAMIYAPVCGSDGVTYGSTCELENIQRCTPSKSGLVMAYDGPCAADVPEDGVGIQNEAGSSCNQVCAEIYQPVCASNGKTYGNSCELDRAACFSRNAIQFVHNGACEDVELGQDPAEEECNRFCTREWAPVCGSDGKTRGNPCELAVDACLAKSRHLTPLTLMHTGECTEDDVVVPQGCEVYFDGCRECVVSQTDGSVACEKKMCETVGEAACRSWFQN